MSSACILVWQVTLCILVFCFFFFSSRRRHTRSLCDWSSDVCSSDLSGARHGDGRQALARTPALFTRHGSQPPVGLGPGVGGGGRRMVGAAAGGCFLTAWPDVASLPLHCVFRRFSQVPVDKPAVALLAPNPLEDMDEVRQIFQEYAASLDVDLQFQDFEAEIADLPGDYASPRGHILLAKVDC